MVDLRIDEASLDALRARISTPEGEEALLNLARVFAEAAFNATSSIPDEQLAIHAPQEALDT